MNEVPDINQSEKYGSRIKLQNIQQDISTVVMSRRRKEMVKKEL